MNSRSCGAFNIDGSLRTTKIKAARPAITAHVVTRGARRRHHSGPVIIAAAQIPATIAG